VARKHELHPNQINTCKKQAIANMSSVFGADKSEDAADQEKQTEKRYARIGQVKVENDF